MMKEGSRMKLKLYRCEICGNLICMVCDSGMTPVCCGREMQPLTANSSDASEEKHIPVITTDGDHVRIFVGVLPHPSVPEHYIEWIVLFTDRGGYLRVLEPGDAPAAEFMLKRGETPVSAYIRCNLHGLWSAEFGKEA